MHRDGVINLVAACVLRSRAPPSSRDSMNTVPFEEYFDPMSILIEDATAPEAPEVIYDFIDSLMCPPLPPPGAPPTIIARPPFDRAGHRPDDARLARNRARARAPSSPAWRRGDLFL